MTSKKTILDTNNLLLNGTKYSYWIQIIFKQIYLTGTTSLGQSRPGSNDNERVLHTPQMQFSVIFRTPLFVGSYPSAENTVSLF